jgi:lysozyme|tara:strand:- start:1369 stop:1824 length:456 start_codon:yes stop_codon:yes gene_type:complete
MQISQEGLSLIKKFEGCELKAYLCKASVLTIGYGHTATTHENMQIDTETAEKLLEQDIKHFEKHVNDLVEVDLEQNQFDALVAWTFNLGPSNLASSTLLKVLNAKDYSGVPEQIKRWNKATVNGERQVLEGLVRRREAESLLFEGKEWHEV